MVQLYYPKAPNELKRIIIIVNESDTHNNLCIVRSTPLRPAPTIPILVVQKPAMLLGKIQPLFAGKCILAQHSSLNNNNAYHPTPVFHHQALLYVVVLAVP